jgi:diguanylate cyclase (GGDEF)-like protein
MKNETIFLKQENQKLEKEIKRLKKMVTIDSLTQIYNRHAFTQFFKNVCKEVRWTSEHASRRQRKEHFSLLFIDIDDFKKINDNYGHLEGDKILKRVAKFLKNSIRDFDIVARWGGEEFAIILRESSIKQAEKKANIILKNASKKLPVTFSIGVIQSDPKYTEKSMFHKVDQAVYVAKSQGKNQVVIA